MGALAETTVMGLGGLAVAAHVLWRTGRRQRGHRGWPWWLAALAAGALAWWLGAWADASAGTGLAGRLSAALTLCWPLLWLAGWRRFHARQALPGWSWLDGAVGAVAVLTVSWAPVATTTVLHLYVLAVLWSASTVDDTSVLRLTGVMTALTALSSILGGGDSAWPMQSAALLAALLACSLLAQAAMAQRTEQELRASRRRLRVMAGTDPLTGVANRRHFEATALKRHPHAAGEPPVLLLLDIDHFKLINDRMGHATGDRALRLVGRSVQEALRESDLAVRLGGDEFALMLVHATLPQAMRVAERVVQQVQREAPAERLPLLTLSFGLVQWHAGEALDDALHRADRALYEAKRQGRACAVAAHGSDDEPAFSESQRLGLTAL